MPKETPTISNAYSLIESLVGDIKDSCNGISCNGFGYDVTGEDEDCANCPVGEEGDRILQWLVDQKVLTKEFLLRLELEKSGGGTK